jgi:Mg2+ and Co2+ transporter CorA
MSEWRFANNSPEAMRIRKAAKELRDAYAEEKIRREKITDKNKQQSIYNDMQRELLECNKRILNLPYSHLEEQAAVVSMLAEHTCMQVMKSREGEMNIEDINWLVNEMQDGIQKLSEIVDRIIKHEKAVRYDSKMTKEAKGE